MRTTILLNKLNIINLICNLFDAKISSTVQPSNNILLLALTNLRPPNIQSQQVHTLLSFSNRQSKIVIQFRIVIIGCSYQLISLPLSFLIEHHLTYNRTHSTVIVLIFKMLLHFLNKVYPYIFRLTVSFHLEIDRFSIVGLDLNISVIGLIIYLTNREEIVKFFCECVPLHVKHPIIITFVEPILHPLLLLWVHQVPFWILIIPGQFRIKFCPRITHLHQFHILTVLQLSKIHSNL